jgi:hypothetical protein
VQIPKVITGALKKEIFDEVVSHYPILSPLVDVLVKTIDDKVEARIRPALDRHLAEAGPAQLADVVDRSAELVLKDLPLKGATAAREVANRVAGEIQREDALVEDARARLNAERNVLYNDKLITQLTHDNEHERDTAADELALRGSTLTDPQRERLTLLMENGTEEWERYVDEHWEGSTCIKRFRQVSVREYAARALGR